MANWKFVYDINGQGDAGKDIKASAEDRGGNLKVRMGGTIPESDPTVAQVMEDAMAAINGLDGLPSDDPASHIKCLDAIIGFSQNLKAQIQAGMEQ